MIVKSVQNLVAIWFLLIAIFTVAAISCGNSKTSDPLLLPTPVQTPDQAVHTGSGDRIRAITTIYPMTFFTEQIGGDRVSVVPLVKPDGHAHIFEPTPGDLKNIVDADILIFNHPTFEMWVERALANLEGHSLYVVQASDHLPTAAEIAEHDKLDPHAEHGEFDPHVWLDPTKAIVQVRRIQQGLSEIDRDGAIRYKTNADMLIEKLTGIDRLLVESLASCQHDEIVVSHLAYGHLAKRYGLHQLGITGMSAESEAGPGRIAEIVERIKQRGIRYILQEPISDRRLAEAVAAETGIQVIDLHPLETLTHEQMANREDFFSIMQKNVSSLALALDCD